MEQYIPKSALVAEINKRIIDAPINNIGHQRVWAYNDVKDIIKTLEVKEVDFDAEWKKYFEYRGDVATINIKHLAKHFFELGISVSNSTKVTIPDIDDVLKENGVNPDSKEAKIIKESYFMAIEKLAQKGEKV